VGRDQVWLVHDTDVLTLDDELVATAELPELARALAITWSSALACVPSPSARGCDSSSALVVTLSAAAGTAGSSLFGRWCRVRFVGHGELEPEEVGDAETVGGAEEGVVVEDVCGAEGEGGEEEEGDAEGEGGAEEVCDAEEEGREVGKVDPGGKVADEEGAEGEGGADAVGGANEKGAGDEGTVVSKGALDEKGGAGGSGFGVQPDARRAARAVTPCARSNRATR
jgi:hypothetical protein